MKKEKSPGGLVTNIEFVKWYDEIAKCIYKMPYDDVLKLYYAATDEWPDDLPLKPDEWDDLGEREQVEYLQYVRGLIEMRVGKKALSRYRHKTEEGMTDQQFDDWWESDQQRRSLEELEEKLDKRYGDRQQSDDDRTNCDNVGNLRESNALCRKSIAFSRKLLALQCTLFGVELALFAFLLILAFFFN